MRKILDDIINILSEVDNKDFNMQKNGIITLIKMIIDSNNLQIILEEELRNGLSPVLLYAKLVSDITPKNEELFEIFAKTYSQTLTNLNYFINYTSSDRELYISSIYKGGK